MLLIWLKCLVQSLHLTKILVVGVSPILDLHRLVFLIIIPTQLGEMMLTNNLNGAPALRHRLL